MKSILVQINRDSGLEARFQAALDITRNFGGHLSCLQVTQVEAFAALDPYGVGHMLSETISIVRDAEQAERNVIETRLAQEDISWDWINESGDPARMVANHSWLNDLVVVSTPPEEWLPRLDAPPTAAEVLVRSRAPVLVVPEEKRGIDCTAPIAIAWNGSPESCAAIKGAIPLLKQAGSVYLINATQPDSDYDLPPTQAATYLSRHGISSELVELNPGMAPITDSVLEAADMRKAGMLVMGAYGHSRLRENILGGVTRGMLQKAKLPLLLAH
ncbi:universal stress protein [Altererythrobacter sp. CC-YST694]|uniref:universal stress protein n=1 Tax=Altererythrobacter sp. CC-YST694 TaxID=2755038 RepID=UPI001D0044C6|nr:universal stress protein [Altererythrobacter sp. CC-YST694]MCB5425883.1 universal stress protein [Altererythrobacter sp. CC-YST694]